MVFCFGGFWGWEWGWGSSLLKVNQKLVNFEEMPLETVGPPFFEVLYLVCDLSNDLSNCFVVRLKISLFCEETPSKASLHFKTVGFQA